MTPEQRIKLYELATAARCIDDDDWGSDLQIERENAFHAYVSDDLGTDTDDMQTAKASSDEMINEALRRAEEHHLHDEFKLFCEKQQLPHVSADELVLDERLNKQQRQFLADFIQRWDQWEEWQMWHPCPAVEA